MSATIDFGIDLGTTNSSMALCSRGEVRVFQNTDLMNVTPSVVHVSKSKRMMVGKKAYDIWVQDPQNTQAEFKRWMGFSDRLKFPASGMELSAEELSAEVLKSLRTDAERQTGRRINASVITVPAAFGSLQCEATGRAAKLAGFDQAPLLQEPVAAAIAYGATPASRNQRWMVFDLGGGTLDIAIVSTRNNTLAVLEHQGNNRLGGKDIDKLIAEAMLLQPLGQNFRLPNADEHPQEYRRLMRAMIRYAEQAKIALSSSEQTTVDIFNIGEDLDQKPIEASIPLTRAEMDAKIAPIIEQCLDLARRAMEEARVSSSDLNRILLVGGPTQMPILRSALEQSLQVQLDYSLDPMTVVAHGAALYASTMEKTVADPGGATASPIAPAGAVPIQLSHERASATRQSPVVGVVDAKSGIHEVKIDSTDGFWTSGWLPLADDIFQVDVVMRKNKPITNYSVTARNRKGDVIRVQPAEFSITSMLPMAAPPLPHTIAIELSTTNDVTAFDPVFKRHCPLPAEARKTYKAERTLRPSEIDATLPIKFWEIEVSDDPQEKWWAGSIHLRAEQIKRPIPEGSDLELIIKIDTSRKMTVEMFIPLLNQSIAENVYIPDPPTARSQMQQQLDLCFERIQHIWNELYALDRGDLAPRIQHLHAIAENIATQSQKNAVHSSDDPEAALDPTEALRKLRIQLTHIEEQLNIGEAASPMVTKMRQFVSMADRDIRAYGNESNYEEFLKLRVQFQRYLDADDLRGLKWIESQISTIRYSLIRDRFDFWCGVLENLKRPGRRFVNTPQAMKHIMDAENAQTKQDINALRAACGLAWGLLPPDQLDAARDQSAQPGLRAN